MANCGLHRCRDDAAKFREDLMNIARTTLSSKILTQYKDHFANLAVTAVLRLKVQLCVQLSHKSLSRHKTCAWSSQLCAAAAAGFESLLYHCIVPPVSILFYDATKFTFGDIQILNVFSTFDIQQMFEMPYSECGESLFKD